MVNKKEYKKVWLTGYRNPEIKIYKTDLKLLGRVIKVVGLGLVGVGTLTLPFPTGSIFLISGGCWLLGLVGINLDLKKKISDKIRLFKYKRGLI